MSYPSAHIVVGPLAEDATVDPEVYPCSSATLLNKTLEAVTFTQEPGRIYAKLLTKSLPISAPIVDLATSL